MPIRCTFGEEQLLKSLPELLGHAAVDAKVERVGEADEEVDEDDDVLDNLVVEKLVDGGGHDVQDGDDAQGKLHCKEHLQQQLLQQMLAFSPEVSVTTCAVAPVMAAT